LDEFVIAELLARGAPIDAFGVGTSLATSKDAPTLGGVYKLVEVPTAEGPSTRAKFSTEKITYPGRKQVFRFRDAAGHYREDVIGCEDEKYPEAEPLLSCVMRDGKRIAASPGLDGIRSRARQELACLPQAYRNIRAAETYP